ncbi:MULTISPECIES: YxeA family protein [Exiguobacterium]|uniref:YxeA family protein n=1 Tax=Exiguobacterium TaxID=33986 RepID=UPI001BE5B625|nr:MULTISPECIES: YxeA family protein [Exiguobacterium]MCT4784552.1 YxeA family protein [Exiguobacterium himgiriensis]
MRRSRLFLILLVIVAMIGWFAIDSNRLFADVYYVRVPNADTVSREVTAYVYTAIGYGDRNKKRSFTFDSDERLAPGDVVKLYVKDETDVTSLERIEEQDVPIEIQLEPAEEAAR